MVGYGDFLGCIMFRGANLERDECIFTGCRWSSPSCYRTLFGSVHEITTEPDGRGCTKTQLGNYLIPRVKDLAQPDTIEPFS